VKGSVKGKMMEERAKEIWSTLAPQQMTNYHILLSMYVPNCTCIASLLHPPIS